MCVSTHALQRLQCGLGLAAALPQGQDGLEDGLTRVHGPVKLVVHVPPES